MPFLGLILGNWKLIAIGALLLGIFWAGWETHSWKTDAALAKEQAALIEAHNKAELEANAKSKALEGQLSALRANYRKINALLDHELKKPDYACAVPIGGLQLINQAAAGVKPR